jgi:hypothetical protein
MNQCVTGYTQNILMVSHRVDPKAVAYAEGLLKKTNPHANVLYLQKGQVPLQSWNVDKILVGDHFYKSQFRHARMINISNRKEQDLTVEVVQAKPLLVDEASLLIALQSMNTFVH